MIEKNEKCVRFSMLTFMVPLY